MEDFFALLEACFRNEEREDRRECVKITQESKPVLTVTCPCKNEISIAEGDEVPETGESECPSCGKEIVIEWEWFPDGTETYWANTPEESEAYWLPMKKES